MGRNINVVIINGKPENGKDSFITACKAYCVVNEYGIVIDYSSIDVAKDALKMLGWDGITKDAKTRKILSDLKLYWVSNNDGPTAWMIDKVLDVVHRREDNDDIIMFMQIIEPEEIKKFRNAMLGIKCIGIDCRTLLVYQSNYNDRAIGNSSDDNVYKFVYDESIDNCGTLDDLVEAAGIYVDDVLGKKVEEQ